MDDLIEEKIPQNNGPFSLNLPLNSNPSTSEKFNESENEK